MKAFWMLMLFALVTQTAVAQLGSPDTGAENLEQEFKVLWAPEHVAQVIDVAREEVLIVTEYLESDVVADALRRAIVERGVSVLIVTSPETVRDNVSYIDTLALAGAHVGLANVGGSMLIADGTHGIQGDAVGGRLNFFPNSVGVSGGESTAPSGAQSEERVAQGPVGLTSYTTSPDYVAAMIEGFTKSWQASAAYAPPTPEEAMGSDQ